MKKILIINSNVESSNELADKLGREDYDFYISDNAKKGVEAIQEFEPDIVLLDILFPDSNGFSTLRKISLSYNIPIIVITEKCSQMDKLLCLEYGADDFIAVPYDIREVELRIRSVLRLMDKLKEESTQKNTLSCGDMKMDVKSHILTKGGVPAKLTPKEFQLIELLMRNKGNVLPRAEILSKIWGENYSGASRTVDIHVQRIRMKLHDDDAIRTVFGVGYKVGE